jgi:hypothetical protein
LDLFHLNIPKHFYPVKTQIPMFSLFECIFQIAKVNLIFPRSTKDPLHIRYCELQDRQTMNTLYFPIDRW